MVTFEEIKDYNESFGDYLEALLTESGQLTVASKRYYKLYDRLKNVIDLKSDHVKIKQLEELLFRD